MNPTAIVAYLVLFAGVALVFVLAALLLGRLIRPKLPTALKGDIYECGEETVGSGFVQFDLRFYVVALLFIVFEVEAAFFFPWAVVFGSATRLRDPQNAAAAASEFNETGTSSSLKELGAGFDFWSASNTTPDRVQSAADRLTLVALADMAVFFGVLLVGFAYVWKRGDLDWVRAIGPPAQYEQKAEQQAAAMTRA